MPEALDTLASAGALEGTGHGPFLVCGKLGADTVSRSLSAAKIPSLSAVRTQVLNRSLSAAKNPSLSAVTTQVLNRSVQ